MKEDKMKDVKCKDFSPTFGPDDPTACFFYAEQDDGKTCGLCKRPDHYRCLNDLGYKPVPLSHNAVQSFLTCHYMFYLQQVLGLAVRDHHTGKPLKMGALWDAVQGYMFGAKEKTDLQAVIDLYEIEELEVQKVKALYKAYKELEISVEEGFTLQHEVDIPVVFREGEVWGTGHPVELHVRGKLDRKYPNYFAENKLSGKPDLYQDIFFIQSQVGTYFMADPSMECVVMEIARTPDLKLTKADEGDPENYGTRVYNDIVTRPSHYFIGYNAGKRTYGKRFYRTEFDLTELTDRYKHIFREIHEACILDGFYKNDRACRNVLPGVACDFINICRYGNASESVFKIREKQL